MNIAQSILEHYESEDFRDNYVFHLMEDTSSCKDRIKSICRTYEFEKHYGKTVFLTDDQTEEIYEYILENMSDFVSEFRNYWTGGTDIDSMAYGEQCEQLTGLYNHRTGKDYSLKYLKQVFEQESFYVSGEHAYYDLSSDGVYIDLLASDIPLLKELTK